LHSTLNETCPAEPLLVIRALSLSRASSISCRLCFFVPRVISVPRSWAALAWPLSESASPKRSVSSNVANSPRVFFTSTAVLTPVLSSPSVVRFSMFSVVGSKNSPAAIVSPPL